MFDLSRLSPVKSIIFIGVSFIVWAVLSVGWYVCGTNHMCSSVAAEAQTEEVVVSLADTQAPVAIAYDRAGAAGEIFVMLMIAFTLGALLGRILATPRSDEMNDERAHEDTRSAPRIGTPVHISELTKIAMRPPIPMPQSPVPTPTPSIVQPAVATAPTIQLGASTAPKLNLPKPPQPMTQPRTQTPSPERPKVRFNTSWSNPTRPTIPSQKKV